MKKATLALSMALLALSACRDKKAMPSPDRTSTFVNDTTYVLAAIPATQPHNVLIENFAGTSGSNCPYADTIISNLSILYSGRINVVSLFVKDVPQVTPVYRAIYDFRTDAATSIEASVYQSLMALPLAGIDRMPIGDSAIRIYQCFRESWRSAVATQLGTADSINLDVVSNYNAATHQAIIKATITYLQPMSTPQNLSIAVVEDGFVDIQEFPGTFDTAYHFNNVLRGLVTSSVQGDAILPTMPTKESGRVYEITYTYDVNTAWNPANCRVVALVHRNALARATNVYQSKQARLAP